MAWVTEPDELNKFLMPSNWRELRRAELLLRDLDKRAGKNPLEVPQRQLQGKQLEKLPVVLGVAGQRGAALRSAGGTKQLLLGGAGRVTPPFGLWSAAPTPGHPGRV